MSNSPRLGGARMRTFLSAGGLIREYKTGQEKIIARKRESAHFRVSFRSNDFETLYRVRLCRPFAVRDVPCASLRTAFHSARAETQAPCVQVPVVWELES